MPDITRVSRLALDVYIAAVYPAGPAPIIMTSNFLFVSGFLFSALISACTNEILCDSYLNYAYPYHKLSSTCWCFSHNLPISICVCSRSSCQCALYKIHSFDSQKGI